VDRFASARRHLAEVRAQLGRGGVARTEGRTYTQYHPLVCSRCGASRHDVVDHGDDLWCGLCRVEVAIGGQDAGHPVAFAIG
jgi:hypothetical protein